MRRRPSNEAGTLLFAKPSSKEPHSISRSEQAGMSFKHSLKEVSNNVMDMLSKWSLVKRELRLGNAMRAADGTSSVEQVLEPKRAMRSEAELREMQSSTLCEEAEHVQQLRDIDGDKTIERQLGDMMRAQEWTTSDMIKAWDKNGDMQIQKMEFRVAIKNQMGNDANHVQIDALFERLDVDSGGSLDEQELRKSIKLMHDTSLAASHQRANTVAHLAYCQERLAQIERCSKPTMAAEAARERHRVLCEAPPLEARVGQVLLALETAKPPVSSAEVAANWDSDGGGRIGKASFVKEIKGYKNLGRLRVDGSNSEVEEQLNRLYESLGERLGADALPITATIEAMKVAAKEVPMKVSEAAEVDRTRIHISHACACAIPSYASSQRSKYPAYLGQPVALMFGVDPLPMRVQTFATLEARALEVQATLNALDIAEKIKWDDARMQERKELAEIEKAKEEQRKRREAKALQRAAEAEAVAREKLAMREARKVEEEAQRQMSARRSGYANKTKDGTKPETKLQPNEYLAPWMKPVPKKGREGKKGKAARRARKSSEAAPSATHGHAVLV